MAEEIKYDVKADFGPMEKGLQGIMRLLEGTKKAVKTTFDKGFSVAGKAAKGLMNTVKGIGNVIGKGLGFGFALKAVNALTDGLMQNQKVQDLMNEAAIVFQGLLNGIIEAAQPVFEWLQKAFSDPKQTLIDLGNAIKDNIMTRLNGILKLVPRLAKSVELLFKGQFKAAAKEAGNAFGEVVLGVEDVVDKVADGVESIKEATKIVAANTKKAFDNRELLANAEKNLMRLQIAYQGIIERYDLMAEKQRQIRDDERNTIDERIAANNELAAILQQQAEEERKNINARIGLLETQQSILGYTFERESEILSLRQELIGVDAKIAGIQSEQLSNTMNLQKEEFELYRARQENALEQQKILNDGLLELESVESRKLQMTLDNLAAEREARLALFDEILSKQKEGTLAYQEALNERNLYLAESAAKEKILEKQITDAQKAESMERVKLEQEVQDQKFAVINSGLEAVKGLLGENSKLAAAISIAQAIMNTYEGATKALAQGGALGPAMATTVVLSGLASVKQIIKQAKEMNANVDTGGAGAIAAQTSAPTSGRVSRNIAANTADGSMQILRSINDVLSKPARSYVVGSDIESQQSLNRRIAKNATF